MDTPKIHYLSDKYLCISSHHHHHLVDGPPAGSDDTNVPHCIVGCSDGDCVYHYRNGDDSYSDFD